MIDRLKINIRRSRQSAMYLTGCSAPARQLAIDEKQLIRGELEF
jgi:hypothetical protein